MPLRFDIIKGEFVEIDESDEKVVADMAGAVAEIIKEEVRPTPEDIRPIVIEEVAKIPPAKDGKSIDISEVKSLVAAAVSAVPRPKDGVSITSITQPLPNQLAVSLSDGQSRVFSIPVSKDGRGILSVAGSEGRAEITFSDGAAQTIDLPSGKDGREIELGRNQTHVQWRYKGDTGWRDLFVISKSRAGGGGAHHIKDLGDVTIAGITDGQILKWNSASEKFVAANDTSGAVDSVNGQTGVVVLDTDDLAQGLTNLYYDDALVSANTDVAANTAARHAAVTLGTANGLSLSTQQLSLAAASTSVTGALTSTDWNAFNGKQAQDATLTSLAAVAGVQGDLLYASGSDAWTRLAKNTSATRYLSNTGSSNNPAWAQINLADGVTGTLPIANGGTGQTAKTAAFDALSPLTTQGDIIYYNGTNNVRLAKGTSGQILSSTATNPSWVTPTPPLAENMYTNGGTFVVGGLYQASGTSGYQAEPATLTNNFIYVGNGSNAPEKRDFKHYSPRMPIQSAKYYAPTHFVGSVQAANQTMFTGFTYFVPTQIEIPFSTITLALNIDTLGVGNMKLGLFEDSGDKPGVRVGISGAIAVTGAGLKTDTIGSLTQKPGKYWLMAEFSVNQTGVTGSNNIYATNTAFSGFSAYGGGHAYNVVIEAYGTDLSDYSGATVTQGVSGAANPWIMMTGVS